jgi:isopenicillin-N N-acyltransferase like protein
MHIYQPGKPRIHMMTEAGIIGKIGLNSCGVGVALNAVRAKGIDFGRLPVHLALRRVLESTCCEEAVNALEEVGVAAACHVLVADMTGSVGLECTAFDVVRVQSSKRQVKGSRGFMITHTNHFIEPHKGPSSPPDLPDSPFRLARINELLDRESTTPSFETIEALLKDEENFPGSICRAQSDKNSFATLFSIIMDLKNCEARVKMGRPTESSGSLTLEP